MANVYGIDLGHHTVRLTSFEGSFGRLNYVGRSEAPVAQDTEAPADIITRLAALDSLFDSIDRHASDVFVLGFPAEQASVRQIHLPFEDREKVLQALPFEVENQVPFDLDDMLLASRVSAAPDGGSNVTCGMAPRDAVRDLLDALTERGVDPKALVVDADLLGEYCDNGVQVVLDIGHTRSLVALCRAGTVVDARALTRGGRELTMALVQAHDIDFQVAERQKHAVGLDASAVATAEAEWDDLDLDDAESWDDETTAGRGVRATEVPNAGAVQEVVKEALVPLLSELRSTLISMEDRYDLEIDEILLTGGGARLKGLRPLLTDILGVPTRPVHVDQDGDPAYALSHSAVVRIGSSSAPLLDLRVDDFAYRGNLAAIGNIVRYSLLGAAAMMVASVAFFVQQTVRLNADLETVEDQIADVVVETFPEVSREKVDSPEKAWAIMREKAEESAVRQEALAQIVPDEPPILSLWEALSNHVPPAKEARIDVSELHITDGNIKVKAETDGFEDAAKIEAALQKYPKFKDTRKSDEKKVKESIRFTLTIPLESEETEEG
ncbi:MAG: hypothetical protein CL927_03725 [Deltaproteobacteria bacterium]|nr:hypothetical protein [Deltaproteobacteria bacterium]HCH61681.1 hypothetical protein [Deltaproteobacteria bacterium]